MPLLTELTSAFDDTGIGIEYCQKMSENTHFSTAYESITNAIGSNTSTASDGMIQP